MSSYCYHLIIKKSLIIDKLLFIGFFFEYSLMIVANTESWIELSVPKGYISYIDKNSIKRKGDFVYYEMKGICRLLR